MGVEAPTTMGSVGLPDDKEICDELKQIHFVIDTLHAAVSLRRLCLCDRQVRLSGFIDQHVLPSYICHLDKKP